MLQNLQDTEMCLGFSSHHYIADVASVVDRGGHTGRLLAPG
jgi:hypothetical protein